LHGTATVIDAGTMLVEGWSWKASIHNTGKGSLLASCFMLEGCIESLKGFMMGVMRHSIMTIAIHDLGLM
jgi:hypothetical protein